MQKIYRTVCLTLLIISTIFWLTVREKDEGTDKKVNHPHGDQKQRHNVSDQPQELPTSITMKAEEKQIKFDGGVAVTVERYLQKILEKEGSIENEVKKVSAISNEISRKYQDLYDKYQKEMNDKKATATPPSTSREATPNITLTPFKRLKLKHKTTASPSKQKVIPNKTLTPFKGMKLVHLDLKGAPPTMKYLIDVMRNCKEYGATGFLIEYEDMFPWSGELELLARKNAYSKADLENVLTEALKLEMEVIPLIQTFGHLEFVLKHKKFADLRAVKHVTTSVCPLNVKSVPMIKMLIDQIIDLHPNSKWVHLGGDEVWNIKNCDKCHMGNYNDTSLYYRHMLPIVKYVKSKKLGDGDEETNLSPIIWDDMMRNWEVDDLKKMAQYVTPMVWGYAANLKTYPRHSEDMWERYMEAFPKIFFASSFKGGLEPMTNFVPIKQHLDNHLSWLDIYRKFQEKEKPVEGIAITGWSRFDHYGTLCELLPAGIPSLALCLAVLNHGGFDQTVHNKTSKLLGYPRRYLRIDAPKFTNYHPEPSTFNGHTVYALVGTLESAFAWRDFADTRMAGWTRPYHVKNQHLSFYHMNEIRGWLEMSTRIFKHLRMIANQTLSNFFDEDTVDEWISDKIIYHQQIVDTTLERVRRIMKKNFS